MARTVLSGLLDEQFRNRAAIARGFGTQKSRVSEWERGVKPCPPHMRRRFAELVGVSESELFDDRGVANVRGQVVPG